MHVDYRKTRKAGEAHHRQHQVLTTAGLVIPPKTDSGYRLYGDDALRTLAFIKHAQRCGFSLADIRELLDADAGTSARDGLYRKAAQKQAEIEDTIFELRTMSRVLSCVLRTDDVAEAAAPPDSPPAQRSSPAARRVRSPDADRRRMSGGQEFPSLSPLFWLGIRPGPFYNVACAPDAAGGLSSAGGRYLTAPPNFSRSHRMQQPTHRAKPSSNSTAMKKWCSSES